MKPLVFIFICAMSCLSAGDTLSAIKERGYLRCGVSTGFTGFSVIDETGNWVGFDVDYCRALSAAIFENPYQVEFVPLTNKDRFVSLSQGHIDVLSRVTSWNFKRDTGLDIVFSGVSFYDAQAVMVREDSDIDTLSDLDSQSVCLITGSTTEKNLFEKAHHLSITFEPVLFTTASAMMRAYQLGRCDAITSDKTSLSIIRHELGDDDEHRIIDDYISKEPLGVAVAKDDMDWFLLTRWVLNVLILAEEKGISIDNIDQTLAQTEHTPSMQYFLDGGNPSEIKALGLKPQWTSRIIQSVGNYGDIFSRHFSQDSDLFIQRDLNQLWFKGGLLYAPPFE